MQVNDILDTSLEGIELIKSFEGFVDHWYQDAVGIWTIGYGTTEAMYKRLTGKARVPGETISQAQATKLLVGALISVIEPGVERLLTRTLPKPCFSALVCFAYNVGPGNLAKSTLLRKVNAGDLEGAAREFGKWTRAGGRVLRGLVRRRAAEEALFRTGIG